jgi:hypothetical protein
MMVTAQRVASLTKLKLEGCGYDLHDVREELAMLVVKFTGPGFQLKPFNHQLQI